MQINSNSKTKKYLIDTSALIALLRKESGYRIVEHVIANSAMSSVNLSELVAVLTRVSIPENEIDSIISDIIPEIIPFSYDLSVQTGKLVKFTKDYGLSLGDRACISTAEYHKMEIYTADKVWLKLQPHVLSKITIIR